MDNLDEQYTLIISLISLRWLCVVYEGFVLRFVLQVAVGDHPEVLVRSSPYIQVPDSSRWRTLDSWINRTKFGGVVEYLGLLLNYCTTIGYPRVKFIQSIICVVRDTGYWPKLGMGQDRQTQAEETERPAAFVQCVVFILSVIRDHFSHGLSISIICLQYFFSLHTQIIKSSLLEGVLCCILPCCEKSNTMRMLLSWGIIVIFMWLWAACKQY